MTTTLSFAFAFTRQRLFGLAAVLPLIVACSSARPTSASSSVSTAPSPPPSEPRRDATATVGASPAAPTARENFPAGKSPSRIDRRSFASNALGVTKQYVVYLPRGYDDSKHRFPVVFLLHGLGGNETNWTVQGKLAQAADALSLSAIVVMPDGDDGFYVNGVQPSDYAACLKKKPQWDPSEDPGSHCVRDPRYEDYVVSDLVSEVDNAYRTLRDRHSRGIAGLSMGGFGALMLAMRHPDAFSAVSSHSGMASLLFLGPHPYVRERALSANRLDEWGKQYAKPFREHVRSIFGPDIERWRAHDPTALVARLDPAALAVHLDCGAADGFHFEDNASYLRDALTARGVKPEFEIVPGGHTWDVWRVTLSRGLRFFQATLAQ